MPSATLRRSLVRGVLAMLLTAVVASASADQDPLELHVIGRHAGDTTATADTGTD